MIKKPQHGRLIILDFDHTVYNTTELVNAMKDMLLKDFDVTHEDFEKKRDEVKQCCVVTDIDRFVNLLPHPDKGAMHTAIYEIIKEQSKSFIFDDVSDFIDRHKDRFDIYLVTHGDVELQGEKIKHSGLPKSVKHVITLDTKDKVVKYFIDSYKDIYFIDDKAENIDIVKTAYPSITAYFMQRPEDSPYGDLQSKCECADHRVKNLKFTIE